jgi:hypothetical protein
MRAHFQDYFGYGHHVDNPFKQTIRNTGPVSYTLRQYQGVLNKAQELIGVHVVPEHVRLGYFYQDKASLKFKPAGWLGSKLGKGGSGHAFGLDLRSEDAYQHMKRLQRYVVNVVTGQRLPRHKKCVIKISTPYIPSRGDKRSYSTWLRDNMSEALTHMHLSNPNVEARVPNCSVALKASDVVPEFYFSGLLRHGEDEYVYVFVMERIHGDTMTSYLAKKKTLTALEYVNMERSIATLWANKIIHGDLHSANIMYDHWRSPKKFVAIDLGHSVWVQDPQMAADIRNKLSEAIAGGARSLAEVLGRAGQYSVPGLQAFTDRVMHQRHGIAWYNPNSRSLPYFYNHVKREERSKVPNMRRMVWGYNGPASSSASKSPTRKRSRSPDRMPLVPTVARVSPKRKLASSPRTSPKRQRHKSPRRVSPKRQQPPPIDTINGYIAFINGLRDRR